MCRRPATSVDLWNTFVTLFELSPKCQTRAFPYCGAQHVLTHSLALLLGVEGLEQRRGWSCFTPALGLSYGLAVRGAVLGTSGP